MTSWFRLLCLSSAALCAAAAPKPLILTTDCGADMDDQWAIAHLVSSPELEVRAIVTTHTGKHSGASLPGHPVSERSAACAKDVMAHLAGGSRPEVLPGSGVPLTARMPLRNPGVDRILAESRAFNRKRRLAVLVIGAATDIASALLTDPSLADRIEVIAMGFKSWSEGGNEYNIQNDPIAWQVILNSAVPITIGDGAVTKRDLSMTSREAHKALDSSGPPGRYLAGLLDDWLTKHPDVASGATGSATRWPVWDEVTAAYLLGFTSEEKRPRPRLRDDLSFDLSHSSGTVTWVTAVYAGRLWADLAAKVKAR